MTPAKTCVHQMEIQQGHFCRSLRLPADADEEGVNAKYREGLLHITIPKRKDARRYESPPRRASEGA
jgi:HSP20 family protein